MPLPFDATLKDLAQISPRGLLTAFDAPPTLPVSLLNIDLSTVTTAADLVFGLGQPVQEIVHLDFQSSSSATKHADIPVYNALLYRQYLAPVHSIVILLRPEAQHAHLHGLVTYAPRSNRGKMDYQYEVIRMWERPADDFLNGDVSVLPLAVLGQLPIGIEVEIGLGGVINQLIDRLQREAAPEQVRRLLTAAFVLTGLRVPRQTAYQFFQGVRTMRDSDTYMAILEEGLEKGREEGSILEARKLILRLGQKSLGVADEKFKDALAAINDLDHLELLAERTRDVKSWQELLPTR
jgi:predicted transposase YdaD